MPRAFAAFNAINEHVSLSKKKCVMRAHIRSYQGEEERKIVRMREQRIATCITFMGG